MALYKGLLASYLGIPHCVIQFNVYEFLNNKSKEKNKKNNIDNNNNNNNNKQNLGLLHTKQIFCNSIIAKSIY